MKKNEKQVKANYFYLNHILLFYNQVKITFLLLSLLALNITYSQNNDCLPILKDGLYKYILKTETSSFNSDLKTYFESQTFKDHFKSNKWNLGVNGVIPVGESGLISEIGLDFGASENEIDKFQEKIRIAKSLQIDEKFYKSSVTAVPDVELAKAYVQCVTINQKSGFFIENIIETPKNVIFNIKYKKSISTDPMPKVKDFKVIGSTKIIQGIAIGENIPDQISISCERYPENELILSINTDRENLVYLVERSDVGFEKEFPVGSIITSILDWNSFSQITENVSSSAWDASKSKWAPADGRTISTSKYTRKTGRSNTPDLRGVFLRGLNQFDPFYTNQVSEQQKDVDGQNRVAGDFQKDIFESHFHTTEKLTLGHRNHGYPASEDLDPGNWAGYLQLKTDSKGGSETRPKNVTVYYYVRIN
ncbi:hypothetical protein LXD69_13860 [Flavobacterium sediminilitoris]|uniref:Tail collar domain n=1 Tax=Flavobacterium sediminilitoris TaxID=2024526 RepID=A0ABY4HJT4_9FLAO|nr:MULTISPECIES: hypothetical protein [Flavobacterium]UOX33119.1 hypothetical protein LXD69_13860 [Flavobacterium sediminilitoris]